MLVICDTNVLISAFIFPGGWPDKIVRDIISGRFEHATSPDILTELRRVLAKKFLLSRDKIEVIVEIILSSSALVYPTERVSEIKDDPEDNRILECAHTAKADFIISGDKKHLLKLKKYKNTHILSPKEFSIENGIL